MTDFVLGPIYSLNLLNKRFSVYDRLSPLCREEINLLPIPVQLPVM